MAVEKLVIPVPPEIVVAQAKECLEVCKQMFPERRYYFVWDWDNGTCFISGADYIPKQPDYWDVDNDAMLRYLCEQVGLGTPHIT